MASTKRSLPTAAVNQTSDQPSKKQKACEEARARAKAIAIENDSNMQLCAPNDTMAGLLHPKTILEFQRTYWEKDPCHVSRNDPTHYGTAFTRESMVKLLDTNELRFGAEVDAYRYVDGVKESFGTEFDKQVVSMENIQKLLDEKQATILFQQPQRYSDLLWNLLEKLECYFGSLVGANAYMTGANAQAFAPHCDDSESFIMQLEGSMQWSIYRPQVELAHGFTQDLPSDFKGKLVLKVELKAGDLLYIPRGFIHEAVNISNVHSTRLEISTYRHTSWGDFLNLAVSQAVENALDCQADKTFRLGIPLQYGSFLGTGKNLQKYIQYSKDAPTPPHLSSNDEMLNVKTFLHEMATRLEKLGEHIDANIAADSLYAEFMNSRLPPADLVPKQKYTAPKLTDSVVLKHKEHVHLTYYAADEGINTTCIEEGDMTADEMTEDEATEDEEAGEEETTDTTTTPAQEMDTSQEEEGDVQSTEEPDNEQKTYMNFIKSLKEPASCKADEVEEDPHDHDYLIESEDSQETCVKLIHSLNNSRKNHMLGGIPAKASSLRFGLHFASALTHLLSTNEYTTVSELPFLHDCDKLHLVKSLYNADLLLIKTEHLEECER